MLKCPQCGGVDVHKSKGAYFGERFMLTLIFRRPVRCYTCTNRFNVWLSEKALPRIRTYSRRRMHKDAAAS